MVDLVLTALVALPVAACWVIARRARARIAFLENELESAQDEIWRREERTDEVRVEGARGIADAEARAVTGDRAKAMFLATVTHEMRTPLSGIIGATDLLLDTALAPDQRAYAGSVKRSAEAMLSLVDDILDLSRIGADRPFSQDAPYAVAELVEGVAELLGPRAQAKGLDLAVTLGAGVPDILQGDAARIRQVLLNLAGNAAKFTETGGFGLRVDADAEGVRFIVEDTGPGFEPAEAERLFGEFERGADVAAGGVGLGLAISRRLAQAMGGALSAEGRPGRGAPFTLSLPLRGAALGPVERPLEGRGVLIVSGGPFSGPWLAERLRAWGGNVTLVGPEAEIEQAALGCDTVLIDRAAGPSAAGLAAMARRGGAERVLLLLAPAERRELARLAADGFDGYLVKPIRAASLLNRLLDPQAEPAAAVPPAAPTLFPGGGLRVLLAEDDPVSALIALAHLKRMGCDATHVEDGEAAVAAFEAGAFDAALIDLRMPRLDGLGVARRMRAAEARLGRARALVVALSANATPQDSAAALDAGADAVLAKPLDRAALAGLLAVSRAA